MAQYVTTADFDAICDARLKLFADAAGAYDSTIFDRANELASGMAKSYAINAGYDLGDAGSTNDTVKSFALAFLVRLAYGRRQREVPPAIEATIAGMPDAIRLGELPIADQPVATPRQAVGGITAGTKRLTFGGLTTTLGGGGDPGVG